MFALVLHGNMMNEWVLYSVLSLYSTPAITVPHIWL